MVVKFSSYATSFLMHATILLLIVGYEQSHFIPKKDYDLVINLVDIAEEIEGNLKDKASNKNIVAKKIADEVKTAIEGDTKLTSKDDKIYETPAKNLEVDGHENTTLPVATPEVSKGQENLVQDPQNQEVAQEKTDEEISGLLPKKSTILPKANSFPSPNKTPALPSKTSDSTMPTPMKRKKDTNMDRVLQTVKQYKQELTAKQKNEKHDNQSPNSAYDADQKLALYLAQYVHNKLTSCWNIPAAAQDSDIKIYIDAYLDISGNIIEVSVSRRMEENPIYEAIESSAIRAVRQCSPLVGLPADKYQLWSKMTLVFDPKNA